VTGADPIQAVTSSVTVASATVEREDDEVQAAMELARFCGSSLVSSAGIDRSDQLDEVQQPLTLTQGEFVDAHNQAQAADKSREETILMQDEDKLSFRVERSLLQATQADILASRDIAIMQLNQDLHTLRSEHEMELRQLKTALNATEGQLSIVRTQANAAMADSVAKDETIRKLKDVPTNEILLRRKLEAALQENVSKDEVIEKQKVEMKEAAKASSERIRRAQHNAVDQVKRNYENEIQTLKNQLQVSEHQYQKDVQFYRAQLATLQNELCHTRGVTDLHKYLVGVEEDLQVLADKLSQFLDPQDRVTLYSTRDPSVMSALPTLRWVSRVYGLYYGTTLATTKDLEDSLQTWRQDRNYFAHNSNADELTRRGTVLHNAQKTHERLAKFIAELKHDRTSDFSKLAKDAFSEI
jgi:hypothetical protein